MAAKKTPKKVKSLPAKALSRDKEKTIKGGYLRIDGIKGESSDDKHKDWIT